ncbi:hypothetical protein SK128_001343, partial [Halocaridina rubra]
MLQCTFEAVIFSQYVKVGKKSKLNVFAYVSFTKKKKETSRGLVQEYSIAYSSPAALRR